MDDKNPAPGTALRVQGPMVIIGNGVKIERRSGAFVEHLRRTPGAEESIQAAFDVVKAGGGRAEYLDYERFLWALDAAIMRWRD